MINCLVFLFMVCMPLCAHQYKFTVCSIFQDEARFLDEWVAYYHRNGTDHIYLYNNSSSDAYQSVLDPWVSQGFVTLHEWPNLWPDTPFWSGCQSYAFTHCLLNYGHLSEWMAFLDVDEYIVPIQYSSIKSLLASYEHSANIAIEWLVFGTSHIWYCPPGHMLENLTLRSNHDNLINSYFKSIVKPYYACSVNNPHIVDMKDGSLPVVLSKSEARINHYWTKDEMFLHEVKAERYRKLGVDPAALFKMVEDFNLVEDREIFRFL